ncbi:MAG: flagellar hook-length control protein FliK [Calditrichaeota bacterium]|nr:MAG: flagellar hook-length control protein FliK [Calditrichota bacterium]
MARMSTGLAELGALLAQWRNALQTSLNETTSPPAGLADEDMALAEPVSEEGEPLQGIQPDHLKKTSPGRAKETPALWPSGGENQEKEGFRGGETGTPANGSARLTGLGRIPAMPGRTYPGYDNVASRTAQVLGQNIPHHLFENLRQQIQSHLTPNATEIRIRLKPDTLGEINLKMVMKDNVMKAIFWVETASVKLALESGVDELRKTLHDRGIQADTIAIRVAPSTPQPARSAPQNPSFWKDAPHRDSSGRGQQYRQRHQRRQKGMENFDQYL